MTWSCFISHRVVDRAIAKTLKKEIESLTSNSVAAYVCEENQGGKNWRNEIIGQILQSDFMIFLYTIEDYDWRWCLYEIGMFTYKQAFASKDNDRYVVENAYQKNALLYFKNPHINTKEILSPLSDIQHYEPTSEDIGKFFSELLSGKFTGGVALNQNWHKQEMRASFDKSVTRTKKRFDQSRLITDYYDKRITINMKPFDEDLQVVDIEQAEIEINKNTIDILKAPPGNTKEEWVTLYRNFSAENQSHWLDELKESVALIGDRAQPIRVMTPFKRGQESFIPVISRVEKLLPAKKEGKDTPTKLNVIFIPRSFSITEFLSTASLLLPICTVRAKWKGKSGGMEYLQLDQDGDLVVSDANQLFLEMFDILNRLPNPDGDKPATMPALMYRIKRYIVDPEVNLRKILHDQATAIDEMVFKCGQFEAKAPLPFNARHPSPIFRNRSLLPFLIRREVRGAEDKQHSTFHSIAFLKDFWPLDHEENPYNEENSQYATIREEVEGIDLVSALSPNDPTATGDRHG